MTQVTMSEDLAGALSNDNSAIVANSETLRAVVWTKTHHQHFDTEVFTSELGIHKSMIVSGGSEPQSIQPMCYVRFRRYPKVDTVNSSSDIGLIAREYYEKIESQLLSLATDADEVQAVEKGAAETALKVVNALKYHKIAPPELSWHGGDAVVMLWALGDTTYAITVTEGELGYVVRRNRKAVKITDSISVDAFRLGDLR
jgi:hypothetical protein